MDQERRDREKGSFERMGENLGGAAGRAMGRGGDMATGMIGSMIGTAIDSLGEWWTSADADRAARSFGDAQDRSCRQHFDGQGSETAERGYDDVRPLYQFGHMASQNPDFSGRDFDEVEPDLHRAWGDASRESHGEWPEVRGFVGFGYSQENPDTPRDV
ncbi:MAG: hypothetical protein WD737_01955 [Gemmatimonadota bacterium]